MSTLQNTKFTKLIQDKHWDAVEVVLTYWASIEVVLRLKLYISSN